MAGAHCQGLLTALLAFMQPIIHAYVSPISESPQAVGGQALLTALQHFIMTSVQHHLVPAPPKTYASSRDHTQQQPTLPENEKASEIISILPKQLPQNRSELLLLDKIRSHVFNKMPIRLLSFNSDGWDIRLVERNEIIDMVLRNIHAESSRQEIEHMLEKTDELLWPDNTAEFNRIVTDLVERHSRYGILSHTWIRDSRQGDVVYKEWDIRTTNKHGYAKITNFCKVVAQNHGLGLAWMDTVCINKDSSSELDESIRSMYKWYRWAHVCVSFMSQTSNLYKLHQDSWFRRGWTLQELLAPSETCFYDMNWTPLGSNNSKELETEIELATTISQVELELCRNGAIDQIPISRKMELAAMRQVTREEDMSYSLMGLLGVEISIAYGEGSERAFFRLIRELLETQKNVLDIFNHNYSPSNKIIPRSLEHYSGRSPVFDRPFPKTTSLLDQWQPVEPITLTHLGVRLSLLLIPGTIAHSISGRSQGDLSGQAKITQSDSVGVRHFVYTLLDSSIYTIQNTTSEDYDTAPIVATFGILNFGVDAGNILLPKHHLFVPLDCGKNIPGNVKSSDSINIIPTCDPPVLWLSSSRHESKIPIKELTRHGMQLVTLYL